MLSWIIFRIISIKLFGSSISEQITKGYCFVRPPKITYCISKIEETKFATEKIKIRYLYFFMFSIS